MPRPLPRPLPRVRAGDWIAVDWGTTTMRARLVSAEGAVRAQAAHGPGMGTLLAGEYEPALTGAVGPWIDDRGASANAPVEVLICGMAGARQGWREAPYVAVPAALGELLRHAAPVPTADPRLAVRIVPGLSQDQPPDVMRGEETQLLGLLTREALGDATVCLPGTHSKWVRIKDRRVTAFSTHMTGEMFALLSERSVLRHSMDEAWDGDAFREGVREGARSGGVLSGLFALRAATLLGERPAGWAAARLSGLLIGTELGAERAPGPVHVVASGALAERYGTALRALDREGIVHDGDALAVAGLAAMRQGAT